MLPSTGYFNGINCPFYDSGLCDRPYCHFRHVKKDPQIANDGIESGTILQKLVSAAVQKVLQQTEANVLASTTQVPDVDVKVSPNNTKATYNPTPISELNKINNTDAENVEDVNEQKRRHIPVPYTPRKPASLPIKRPAIDTNGSKPFIYVPPTIKYTPGSAENVEADKYTPPGAVDSKEKYMPGTETQLQEYTPDTSSPDIANKRNYVPSSDKITNKSKLLEYKPSKVSVIPGKPSVTYQPTPRSLAPCFSSDEDEPDTKKRKVSSDLNGLDDLGAEFDILGQILDEEKSNDKDKTTKSKEDSKKSKTSSNNNKRDIDASKKEKSELSKSNKSHHKSKSHSKEKSTDKKEDRVKDKHRHKDKEKEDKKKKKEEKSSHKSSSTDENHEKLSHKSSSKDKNKDKTENKSKHSSDKKKHSSRSHSPKSKHSSSKSSEKHSDSKSSRKDSKSKDKHKAKSHKSSKKKDESKRRDDSDREYLEENGIEEEIELSEDDEETIALECKKIFEEYVPEAKSNEQEDNSKVENINIDEEEYIPTKKRVSRTVDKNIKIIPKPSLKPDFKVSAAQAMADRLAKVREFHSSKNQTQIASEPSTARPDLSKLSIIAPSPAISKIRIAHVPYASTLVSAKKTITPAQSTKSLPSTSSTICQTVKKGSQRVAHVPSEKFIDRPGVLEPLGSKIPANIRSTYLNMMIDECLKLYISATDAYARAQNEELNTSKKCSTVQIYKNSAAMTVSRLRRELQENNGLKKLSETSGTQSNSTGTWSIEGRNKKLNDNCKEFIGARFYENIMKWVLTEEQLRENGFPRPHESDKRGRATIYVQNNKQKPPKGYLRTCCRCKKEYMVNKKGFAAVKDECIYHPNNKYRVRGEARYQCCSQDTSSDGCCVAPSHVYEYVDYDNLKGYVRTLPPEHEKDDYGVYSLDCEMCYTTHGLDLTRVTVINSACKVVYETLIKPIHPIIDYNTRYSGITEEQMSQVKTTLLEVQATLLAMFNSKTILVGHSLESDFKALKLIHDTVVDTSVLFPHKMGPPYKRALRNLSSEHLKKIIQNSVEGHDSAEDAMVCMELIHYKLKEDLKTR